MLALAALILAMSPVQLRGAQSQVETVVTGLLRPLQLVWDGQALIVLSYSARGDAAGELYRIAIDSSAPVDLAPNPRR
jgi:hypothetical protein